MPTYTDDQRTHATTLAAQEGCTAAARATGIHPATIRRWATQQAITLPDGPTLRAAGGDKGRATRTAIVEERQTTGAARMLALLVTAGELAEETATQLLATLGEQRLTIMEAVRLSNSAWTGPDDARPAGLEASDVMWRRVRMLADTIHVQAKTYGIGVDKLARLAGEDSPLPSGSASATVNVALLMETDPEFRATVIAGTKERIAAQRGGAIDVEGSS